ncbi:hypothetical protein RN001_001046 [Aquatica leii]|uniref:StAR-related lipid transfer protein 3 n=1 Tax=Aquatica leii TaxID=1421715 RepID=A0AAN7SSK1_9COLE|nr:hypothetical protein RN001_001046 [Aquatica leii]
MSVNEDVRIAAETLLRSSNSQHTSLPNNDISRSYSINALPPSQPEYVISEELITNQRGNMSNVRRFFCLFVTFDLAFTGLLWLICIMINGQNISTAIDKEIYHYSIHTSLFDIVIAAVCRFLLLLLFYGLFSINHWIIIALCTTATSAFLIAKVFQYNWVDSHQPVFDVLLILTSFVISWGEAWFFDFRVLPQELHSRRILINTPENERAPLIRSYVQGLPSMYTESVGNFYSPLGSPEGSIHEVEHSHRKYLPVKLTAEQDREYKMKGAKIIEESWRFLNNSEWKLEKRNVDNDSVHILSIPNVGKMFKLTALVNTSPQYLLEELFYKVETIPQWNPALLESHKVQSIDEYTDICYQISSDSGGVVSSRDFVNIRHWGVIDGCFVIAYCAVEHPAVGHCEKYVRGENGVGCWAMRPIPGQLDKCIFEWVLNTNLKGWILNIYWILHWWEL